MAGVFDGVGVCFGWVGGVDVDDGWEGKVANG